MSDGNQEEGEKKGRRGEEERKRGNEGRLGDAKGETLQ